MVKIENWVVFPEHPKVPIKTCNLYEAYGLSVPDLKLVDDNLRNRFGVYIYESPEAFNFEDFRKKCIIMYITISPKMKQGESQDYALFKAALDIAAEESTGTWETNLSTITEDAMDADSQKNMEILQAKVIGLNVKTGVAGIAYPVEGFERGNMPQVLSVVMGNYNGMTSAAWGVRLEDLDFPDDFANSFMGPQIGNDGIRALLGEHITVGTIVKPKTGLSEADWAKTATKSYMGGLDVVKDDENLTSQDYCTFEKRAQLVFEGIKEVKKKTGREVIYVPNITHGDIDEMMRRGKLIESLGGNCLMIDILACGIAGVQSIRKHFPKMILHGHRAGHGAQTIFPEIIIDGKKFELRHGTSMKAWALIARLAGIDQLHIGAPKGKMEASSQTVLENLEACYRPLGKIKSCRPIASGGLKATVMWDVAKIMNPHGATPNMDFIFQAGGGTHAHDLGTFGGAKSLVQARDAIKAGIDYLAAMSLHFETLLAFKKWEKEIYQKWLKSLKKDSKIVVEPDLRPYPKDGKYTNAGPKAADIKTAVSLYPPLKADLEAANPSIL